MKSSGLVQHVNCTTRAQHTIDLLLTKEEFAFDITKPENVFPISDHGMIKTVLDITKPPVVRKDVQFRRIKSIDHEKLDSDLKILVDRANEIKGPETTVDVLE